jgi:DNA-binding HxlR family transcriptional regulator
MAPPLQDRGHTGAPGRRRNRDAQTDHWVLRGGNAVWRGRSGEVTNIADAQKRSGIEPAQRRPAPDWHAVHSGIEIVASKWALSVMAELSAGRRRHNELSRALDVDHKQLGRALRRLQQAHVVARKTVVDHQQLQVWYQLTPAGRDLLPLLAALGEWSDKSHLTALEL